MDPVKGIPLVTPAMEEVHKNVLALVEKGYLQGNVFFYKNYLVVG